MTTPKISVVMSVYNGEEYLRLSIDSILNQTFTDFEFIIINDGSTDNTKSVLKSYSDDRLTVINHENRGLTKSLNEGLKIARGEYVARQDADDLSTHDRFEKQSSFLDANEGIALLGSWIGLIDRDGDNVGEMIFETNHEKIVQKHPEVNQFSHGAIMLRSRVISEVGGYREQFIYSQDYDLTLRMIDKYTTANIPEILSKHRLNPGMISSGSRDEQKAFSLLARNLWIQRSNGLKDQLDAGEPVENILPQIDEDDPLFFQKQMVHLWLKCGHTKKARSMIIEILRNNAFQIKPYFYLALTLVGPRFTQLILKLWGRLRHGSL